MILKNRRRFFIAFRQRCSNLNRHRVSVHSYHDCDYNRNSMLTIILLFISYSNYKTKSTYTNGIPSSHHPKPRNNPVANMYSLEFFRRCCGCSLHFRHAFDWRCVPIVQYALCTINVRAYQQ